MSMMKCDTCSELVDTDELPLSMYATENLEGRKPNGQDFDCLCPSCWENQEQMPAAYIKMADKLIELLENAA